MEQKTDPALLEKLREGLKNLEASIELNRTRRFPLGDGIPGGAFG